MRVAVANAEFGAGYVRHRVASGRWQKPVRGVVVCHNGPLSNEERDALALCAAPPGAALAGWTSLRIDGLQAPTNTIRFVVVGAGSRTRDLAGVRFHESTQLGDVDVHPSRTPRRTRPARSAIDAAAWAENLRMARWVVIATIQQGLASPAQIREAMTRRGPCRHRAVIKESTFDAEGGKHSLPERDFQAIWDAVGLPPISRQHSVRTTTGRYFLDAYCDALGFGVEIHGIPHLRLEQWDADLSRANEITIAGEPRLTFPSFAIRHEPVAVANQLWRMAAARGWTLGRDLATVRQLLRPKRRFIGPDVA